MEKIGSYAVPVVILIIIVTGFIRKTDVFSCFTDGIKEGITSLIMIAPTLVGLIIAVTMLGSSGFFEILSSLLTPVCNGLNIPTELIPLIFMKPISGSGSTAILSSILEKCGPDSTTGMMASVIAGSTETTFYTIAVYYGAVGMKKK